MASHSNPGTGALLESASWPSFFVDEEGIVRHANQTASILFGPRILEDPPLDTLWVNQSDKAVPFLRSSPPSATIQFTGRDSNVQTFTTRISSMCAEGKKWYLFQLFRMEAPQYPQQAPPIIQPVKTNAPAPPPAPTVNKTALLEEATELARTVAVEVNNALTSILGHASLVLSQLPGDHECRSSLEEVEKATERAAAVVQRLVDFSKPPPQQTASQTSELNLTVQKAIQTLALQNDRRLKLTVELESSPHHVNVDDPKILHAFVKVLENSREAVQTYGSIHITSRNEEVTSPRSDESVQLKPGLYVCVEVTDDGSGMRPDVKEHVFEPFFTTKPGHRGLGLPWVYGIITNIGGCVAISSEMGRGCSVRIYLPATRSTEDPAPKQQTKPGVLIVDAEQQVLDTGRAILANAGYDVLAVTTAEEALEITAKPEISVDLIILDRAFLQSGETDLLNKLKETKPNASLLRLSGLATEIEKNDKSCLQKPFTSRHLLERVNQALDVGSIC